MTKKLRSILLVFAMVLSPLSGFFSFPQKTLAATSANWTSESDFSQGANSDTSETQYDGDVTLEFEKQTHIDTTKSQFDEGDNLADSLGATSVSENGGGEVVINQGWSYAMETDPAVGNNHVYHSFLDETNNLLYASTYGGGLSVINTQGTVSPADDTLVTTYTTSSTPAIGDNYVYHSFLNETNNLLYVSTSGGGLSVINTQGTVSPADDTLVTTYTTSSTPAIGNNYVHHSFLDETNNLLYASTSGGLSVINTQGTVSPADDTLVTTYTTSSTPAIGNNYVHHSFLDETNNLLYVSTYSGGLSVINLSSYSASGTYLKDVTTESSSLWETKASLDTARIAPASGVIDGKIYVAGGTKNWTDKATMEMYDPISNTWTYKASLSEPRVTPGSVVIDDKLYVIGGRDENWDPMDSLEVYDPDTNTWTAKAPITTAVIGPATTVLDGKMYVMGGLDESWAIMDSLEVYNPDTNTWETKASMPEGLGNGHTAQAINGKIYVVGGKNDGDCSPFSKSLYVYDPDTNTWEVKLSMPEARIGLSSVAWNDQMMVFGGTDYDYDPRAEIFIYDPIVDIWWKMPELPLALHRLAPQMVNGDLYVIGGKNLDWNSADGVYKLSSAYLSGNYQKEIYSDLTWEATIPNNTSIEMFYSLNGGKTYTSLGTTPGTYNLPAEQIYSFRYKAVLSTDDTTITPSLNSVSLKYAEPDKGLYQLTGTYTSNDLSYSDTTQFNNFIVDSTTPIGTTLFFQYSLNSGETWNDIILTGNSFSFPEYTKSSSFRWRANLATIDANQTPIIHSVILNHEESTFSNNSKKMTISKSSSFKKELDFNGKNYTRLSRPKLQGSNFQAKNGRVKIYKRTYQGSKKKIAVVDIDKDGYWSYKFKKAKDGSNIYYIKTFDSVGNGTDSFKSLKIIRDTKDPVFITFPESKTYQRGDRLVFTATDETTKIDSYKVKLLPLRDKWRKQDKDFYIIPEDIPNGNYTFQAKVSDKAGNKVEREIFIKVADCSTSNTKTDTVKDTDQTETQEAQTENETEKISTKQEQTESQQLTPETKQQSTPITEEDDFIWWNPWTW